jgi:hypothetical protein
MHFSPCGEASVSLPRKHITIRSNYFLQIIKHEGTFPHAPWFVLVTEEIANGVGHSVPLGGGVFVWNGEVHITSARSSAAISLFLLRRRQPVKRLRTTSIEPLLQFVHLVDAATFAQQA